MRHYWRLEPQEEIMEQSEATLNINIPQTPPHITFHVENGEMLRIAEDGFFVDGLRVIDANNIYEKFCEWMEKTREPYLMGGCGSWEKSKLEKLNIIEESL